MISTSPRTTSSYSFSYSPTQSPRESISSSNSSSAPPLTPIYELDKMNSDLIVSTEEVDDVPPNGDGLDGTIAKTSNKGRVNLPSLQVPPPTFSNYSFGSSSSPSASSSSIGRTPSPLSSVDDISLPTEGFKFGTCSSKTFVGTPTAEQGPFDYPSSSSSTMSTSPPLGSSPTNSLRRGSFALGMTHRRGSIIPPPQVNPPQLPDGISPPPTRRSSTCSTITTLPVAGRRPSIVHSTTVEVALPQVHPSVPPFEEYPPLTASASSSRRPSVLMFPSKPLPAPIPPSLLARRGSLPAAQLFGLPTADQLNRASRASYSSGSATISTASLYLRRQSVVSESGFSNGSGATVMDGFGNGGGGEDNGSRRPSLRPRTPSADFTPKTMSSTRRGSVSFFPPVPSQLNTQQTPNRSSSLSSRSSVTSNSSSHRSSTSSRVPINFSPRHPSSHHNSFAYPSRQSSITSLSNSNPSLSSSSSSFIPLSPKIGYTLNNRRSRHSTSGTTNSNPGLSSSEEDDQEEELPTPNQSRLVTTQGQLPSAPTFVDPWSTSTTTSIENKLGDLAVEDNNDQSYIPMETPPLETVLERPPLESVDSTESTETQRP